MNRTRLSSNQDDNNNSCYFLPIKLKALTKLCTKLWIICQICWVYNISCSKYKTKESSIDLNHMILAMSKGNSNFKIRTLNKGFPKLYGISKTKLIAISTGYKNPPFVSKWCCPSLQNRNFQQRLQIAMLLKPQKGNYCNFHGTEKATCFIFVDNDYVHIAYKLIAIDMTTRSTNFTLLSGLERYKASNFTACRGVAADESTSLITSYRRSIQLQHMKSNKWEK